ncbi:protein disulfide oxidoreductase [Conchiformibius kuhniae]|uniref:Protein disulfide oxidoreductase n=1 Tax=Conchiformibius kuhniae TaxID=211502 RepID=A0A8T9MWL8_9NEIS|nr:protein disulfide oxidoreductase [Conchiformibius kuhniae]UOP04828.1 protein disulfide oxidoreductase [Conchiformibius kuhniae]
MNVKRRGIAFRLKQAVQLLLVVLLASTLADWWRSPAVPHDAARLPMPESAQTLAQASANETVVLYFWATWCGACRHTSPVLERLRRDGVRVVGIALQSGGDEDVQRYLREHHLHFATLNDPRGELARHWNVRVTPTIVFVRGGKVRHNTSGIATYWGLKTRLAAVALSTRAGNARQP